MYWSSACKTEQWKESTSKFCCNQIHGAKISRKNISQITQHKPKACENFENRAHSLTDPKKQKRKGLFPTWIEPLSNLFKQSRRPRWPLTYPLLCPRWHMTYSIWWSVLGSRYLQLSISRASYCHNIHWRVSSQISTRHRASTRSCDNLLLHAWFWLQNFSQWSG
jgi:hypothetical protein